MQYKVLAASSLRSGLVFCSGAVACVLATLAVFMIEPGPHVDFVPRD